ncbi:MAG: glycoside hydrolase family 2 TIM barrel-domain containing protein [Lentisphaeria bacterium]|nr:glycoside hydrolase family 2 TIM barrel-domain containing protein [Lentisphaeria bacterium]
MARQLKREPVRVNPVLRHRNEQVIGLGEGWRFRLDPDDQGQRRNWFTRPALFKDEIAVPGTWQGQGFGDAGTDYIWDFQLHRRTFRATYTGTGWYAKSFSVPEAWRGKRIWLNFGAAYPFAEVYLNGEKIGNHNEPFVPFGFDVTSRLKANGENFCAVRISERDRVYGLSFCCRGNWSGLYRAVELSATGEVFMDRCWLHPDVDKQKVRCTIKAAGGAGNDELTAAVVVREKGRKPVAKATRTFRAGNELTFDVPVAEPLLWSPERPYLYTVDVVVRRRNEVMDAVTERIGFVKLSTAGKHLCVNGDPYYIRQNGDHMVFPETVAPDTDRKRWRRKLKTFKAYGYNAVRCSDHVATPEYYDVADELGILIQGDIGMLGAWGGNGPGHIYAWPQPHPKYREVLRSQWNHTVMRDVNHPSAIIYGMANELQTYSNNTLFPKTAWRCYHETKAIKPSAMVIWSDGGMNEKLPQDFVNYEGYCDHETTLPMIQHEYRWWSSFPDVRIKKKYKDTALRPIGIDLAEEAAAEAGLQQLLPVVAHNSQRIHFSEMKAKMDRCRRNFRFLAGICHFCGVDIHCAPMGVLDMFYEKKLVDAETWLQTNGDTVLLMDHEFEDRIYTAGDKLTVRVSISDFAHPPLKPGRLEWKLGSGRSAVSGSLKFRHTPFCTSPLGVIRTTFPETRKPQKLQLSVRIAEGNREVSNQWDFWLFPRAVKLPKSVMLYGKSGKGIMRRLRTAYQLDSHNRTATRKPRVLVTEKFDQEVLDFARGGGRVLLLAGEGLVRPFYPPFLAEGWDEGLHLFAPQACYPPFADGYQASIIRAHRMLGNFPHEGFMDLQFFRLLVDAPAVELDPLGRLKEEPVIRQFGTYQACPKLAYLLEFALGEGGIIISAFNLDPKLPEARYLLSQMLRYAAGKEFRPQNRLSAKATGYLVSETNL